MNFVFYKVLYSGMKRGVFHVISFLYTNTQKKVIDASVFFSFFLSALLWASYVLLGCDFYYCDEKMFTKIMTKRLDWEWDVKERCWVSFLKERERSRRGLFFFSTFSIMYYILLEWQRRIFGFFFVLGAVFVICSILIASNNGLEK